MCETVHKVETDCIMFINSALEYIELKKEIIRRERLGGRAKCIRKKRIYLSGFYGFTRIIDKNG